MSYLNFFKSHGLEIFTDDGKDIQIRGISSLPGNKKNFVLQYARQNKIAILIEVLWAEADTLADWIDNPGSEAPWQDRAARVSDLEAMSKRIEDLIQQRDSDKTKSFCGEFVSWIKNRKTAIFKIATCPALPGVNNPVNAMVKLILKQNPGRPYHVLRINVHGSINLKNGEYNNR